MDTGGSLKIEHLPPRSRDPSLGLALTPPSTVSSTCGSRFFPSKHWVFSFSFPLVSAHPTFPTLSRGRNSLPFPASRHPSGEAASSPHLCLRHHQGPLLPSTSLRCVSPRIQAAISVGPLCLLLILLQGPLPSLSFLYAQPISLPSRPPSPACISE